MHLKEIESTIKTRPAVLLYFWAEHCNVCHALKPKLFKAFEDHFPEFEKISVNVGQESQIAAQFGVFSIPTAIVFLDGKEFARISRNVSIPELIRKIERPYSMLFS